MDQSVMLARTPGAVDTMSNRNRNRNTAAAVEAVADTTTVIETAPLENAPVSETTEVIAEPIAEPTTTEVVTAPVASAPEPVPAVYGRTEVAPNENYIRKGFETVLFAEINKGPGTIAGVTARLLASGEYQRVAPRAAELRAPKPVTFLLNKWVRKGLLQTAEGDDALAVIAMEAALPEVVALPVATEVIDEPTEAAVESASTEQPVEASV